ncbi:MAG: AMP-binding protein, partial [Acidobacteriota bacterium]
DARVRRLLGPTIERAAVPLGCRTPASLRFDGAAPTIGVDADDLALVQFSSGTTVAPKPVALSHRAIIAQVEALNSFWPDDDAVRHSGVSWLPLYHDMGLIGCIFPALERPSVLTLIGPEIFVTKPALWLRAISRYRATISVAPNFAYALCVDRIRDDQLDDVDLASWRVALNGAEAVSPGVLRAFQERFAAWGFRPEALTPVYGLSEATLGVTFSRLDQPFRAERFDREALAEGRAVVTPDGRELIAVGQPLPGTAIRIVDATGDELSVGHIGRVQARGPSIMDGYLDRPDATADALSSDGWLDTGDLGFLHVAPAQDGDGGSDLFLVGRAKDVLILRGRNHDPAEVEHTVDTVAGARKGCAVAVGYRGEDADTESLWLFVEHARDAASDVLDRLPERCAEAVLAGAGLRAESVFVVAPGTLPRTSSGKLRRSETLRRHLAGELDAPKAVTPVRLAGELVRSTLAHARARARRAG